MKYFMRGAALKIVCWQKMVADENFEGLNESMATFGIDLSFFNNFLWRRGHKGINRCDH
jgi:hypothetical protein